MRNRISGDLPEHYLLGWEMHTATKPEPSVYISTYTHHYALEEGEPPLLR
eukprot:COSAG02_NODE_52455_length_307_cov_1.716346_1_plen_49_part_10